MARRVMQEGAGARRPKVVVKRGLRRWPPGVVVKRGCAAVDGGTRRFRRVMRGDGGGRRFRGIMQEGAEGRRPGGFMQEGAEGRRFRRVAAVPVCPPFRDRSRGGREVGAVPPVAGGCCEAGLCRCGRRGAAVPGDYARGRRGRRPGGWLSCRFVRHFVTGRGVAVKWGLRRRSPGVVVKRGCAVVDGGARQFRGVMREDGGTRRFRGVMREDGGARRFRGVMREDGGGAAVPGDYARGRRRRRPGGWLPCRFARHFVTGRRGLL